MTNNIPEYTVTELSNALKNVVETSFEKIIVKGEVSRIFIAQSGHAYITIKDEYSVLETICFKNVFEKIKITPEQGLEVQCKGRMSTFSKKSSYQLIITDMRPAGLGALMAMLEARKLKLLKEGYFDQKTKKEIPFLPDVVGVITSLKGAVIRDILHRFRDRFPREVLIWPTLVQGDDASSEIINAITGFNKISNNGSIKRPDVIIVARGGGSIEDLWCFNDEELIITVSNSNIPIISNYDANINIEIDKVKSSLKKQMANKVKWTDSITKLEQTGVKKIIEIGPGKVLSGLIMRITRNFDIISIDKIADLEKLK